jgi:hypothetical protein
MKIQRHSKARRFVNASTNKDVAFFVQQAHDNNIPLNGCCRFLQYNTCTCPVGSKHNSNPKAKKNMDDGKRGGEERIAEHTSRHESKNC